MIGQPFRTTASLKSLGGRGMGVVYKAQTPGWNRSLGMDYPFAVTEAAPVQSPSRFQAGF
jgi:hypothetical protein